MSRLAVAVAAVTLLRLLVAAMLPLAADETYYWVWSHALAPGYLDHPPMVALWIRAGTFVAGQTALGGSTAGAAGGSTRILDGVRYRPPPVSADKGWDRSSPAAEFVPAAGCRHCHHDARLTVAVFWSAALWAMARIATGGAGVWWLAAGLFAGLAMASKYTAVFLWIGVALWVLLVPAVRPWLRRWQPWAACAIGFALFAPVLWWNATHAWAGFARQGGRVGDWQPTRALGFLAELVGAQIGLATPLVWVLCMMGLVAAARHAWRSRDTGWSLLAALSLPPVLVFVQHAIGDRVQGNWPAIIYPALAIAAGGLALRPRWWAGAAGTGLLDHRSGLCSGDNGVTAAAAET